MNWNRKIIIFSFISFVLFHTSLYAMGVYTVSKRVYITTTQQYIDVGFKFYYDREILLSYVISFNTENQSIKDLLYQIQSYYNKETVGKFIDGISTDLKPINLLENESKSFIQAIIEFENNIMNKSIKPSTLTQSGIASISKEKTIAPVFCTQEYIPVCGTNGKTYVNKCYASDQHIAYDGECNNIDKIADEIPVNDDLTFALKQFFIALPTEYIDQIKISFQSMHPTLRDRILFYFDKYSDVYKDLFFSINFTSSDDKINIINIYTDILERIYTLDIVTKAMSEKDVISIDLYMFVVDAIEKIKRYKYYEYPLDLLSTLDQINIFSDKNVKNNKLINTKLNEYLKKISDILISINYSKYNKGLIPFVDVDEDGWYVQYLTKAKQMNLIQGYKDNDGKLTGVFGVFDEIKLSEALKIVLSAFDIPLDKQNMPQNMLAQNHWARDYYVTAEKLGVSIVQNPYENLNRSIQRDEFISLILEVKKTPTQDGLNNPFIDLDASNGNYLNILKAYQLGLIKGDSGKNTIRPYDKINRVEVIKIILLSKEKL